MMDFHSIQGTRSARDQKKVSSIISLKIGENIYIDCKATKLMSIERVRKGASTTLLLGKFCPTEFPQWCTQNLSKIPKLIPYSKHQKKSCKNSLYCYKNLKVEAGAHMWSYFSTQLASMDKYKLPEHKNYPGWFKFT